jgi:DNA (cytosine-5)-methyltransferase 1
MKLWTHVGHSMSRTNRTPAFDFFCGSGGLSCGLVKAGFRILAGFDIDPRCRKTYEHNNPGVPFIEHDIRTLTVESLRELSGGCDFKSMLFAGCAPCQPFSRQSKAPRRRNDATLLGSFARLVEEARPGFVLIENVPGIASVKGNSTFKRFLRTLGDLGYCCDYGVIDAKDYGVPQKRRRLILIAAIERQPSLPKKEYGTNRSPFLTVRQAISHFPPVAAGEAHPNIPNHAASLLTPLNLNRIRCTPHNGGDRRSWSKELRLECHTGDYEGHTDVYGRMAWDAPAPTLTGRCHSLSNGRYGHPTQDRAITLREAAALQTFPDDYVFFGSRNHIALQIGNAVPVRLAEILGRCILSLK